MNDGQMLRRENKESPAPVRASTHRVRLFIWQQIVLAPFMLRQMIVEKNVP